MVEMVLGVRRITAAPGEWELDGLVVHMFFLFHLFRQVVTKHVHLSNPVI